MRGKAPRPPAQHPAPGIAQVQPIWGRSCPTPLLTGAGGCGIPPLRERGIPSPVALRLSGRWEKGRAPQPPLPPGLVRVFPPVCGERPPPPAPLK